MNNRGSNKKGKYLKVLKITVIIIVFIVFTLYTFFHDQSKEESGSKASEVSKTTFAMGTMIQMGVYGENSEEVIQKCFDRIREIENKMSKVIKTSDIYIINQTLGEDISVNYDTFQVLKKAYEYAEETHGLFDPTIGPLVELWGIGTKDARIPGISEIHVIQDLVNFRYLELDEEKMNVKLLKEGMKLDLGAIAKGYAADEIRKIVLNNDINGAYINIGGNVLVVGTKADGNPWNIGIQDPRLNSNEILAVIELRDKAIVTSGNYERYFKEDGVIYHHILDPATGRPARNGLESVSVITDNSIDADALSTAVYIMGADKGMEFVENKDNVEAVFVKEDLSVLLTGGLKGRVELLNDDFRIFSDN